MESFFFSAAASFAHSIQNQFDRWPISSSLLKRKAIYKNIYIIFYLLYIYFHSDFGYCSAWRIVKYLFEIKLNSWKNVIKLEEEKKVFFLSDHDKQVLCACYLDRGDFLADSKFLLLARRHRRQQIYSNILQKKNYLIWKNKSDDDVFDTVSQ